MIHYDAFSICTTCAEKLGGVNKHDYDSAGSEYQCQICGRCDSVCYIIPHEICVLKLMKLIVGEKKWVCIGIK